MKSKTSPYSYMLPSESFPKKNTYTQDVIQKINILEKDLFDSIDSYKSIKSSFSKCMANGVLISDENYKLLAELKAIIQVKVTKYVYFNVLETRPFNKLAI